MSATGTTNGHTTNGQKRALPGHFGLPDHI